jgi:hypothetical protein
MRVTLRLLYNLSYITTVIHGGIVMPKQKITQAIILDAAFSLVREEGFEKVNARSIANRIGCSVQPIYSYFGNMEALMKHLHVYVNNYYIAYVETSANRQGYFASIGKCHISFAKGEKLLFRFLFQSPYLQAESFRDVYKKLEKPDVTQSIQDTLDLTQPDAEELYMNMMIYTHGIACMIATDAAEITFDEVHPKLNFAYLSFLSQLKKGKV